MPIEKKELPLKFAFGRKFVNLNHFDGGNAIFPPSIKCGIIQHCGFLFSLDSSETHIHIRDIDDVEGQQRLLTYKYRFMHVFKRKR